MRRYLPFFAVILLCGCRSVSVNESFTETESSIVASEEQTYTGSESFFKYGSPSISRIVYDYFDSFTETDSGKPTYAETNIIILYDLNDEVFKNEVRNAINDYLVEKGYDFTVEIVGCSSEGGGTMAMLENYLYRKESGLQTDIYMATSCEMPSVSAYKYLIDNRYAMNIDGYLETEAGERLLDGLKKYMSDDCTDKELNEYLDYYRYEGNLYGIPGENMYAFSYLLGYNDELKDYYGIPSFTGTLKDLDIIEEYGDVLLADGVAPIVMSTCENCLYPEIAGLYSRYPLICFEKETDGSVLAVDPFENETLLTWYDRLGELNEKGYVDYGVFSDEIEDFDSELQTSLDLDYAYAVFQSTVSPVGWLTMNYYGDNSYETNYDILDVETFYPVQALTCIDADTLYPDECFEVLSLLYSDLDFRNLLQYGQYGWGYYVDDSSDSGTIIKHTENGGMVFGYGLENSNIDLQNISSIYSKRVQEEYASNSVCTLPYLDYFTEMDFSDVEDKYNACLELYNKYECVMMGVYGEDTRTKVNELHEKLLEAGYKDVIDCVNAQLQK